MPKVYARQLQKPSLHNGSMPVVRRPFGVKRLLNSNAWHQGTAGFAESRCLAVPTILTCVYELLQFGVFARSPEPRSPTDRDGSLFCLTVCSWTTLCKHVYRVLALVAR